MHRPLHILGAVAVAAELADGTVSRAVGLLVFLAGLWWAPGSIR